MTYCDDGTWDHLPRESGMVIEGGQVTMPLSKTFFSPKFGMLRDRFGVHWMVYVQG